MAQTRQRSAPPSLQDSPEEASLAPLPQAASLVELREAMGSPGVIQAEVDALLAALRRPLAEGETPRARADFLLSLMELPEEAAERTGSDGRPVRAAAVEALMELGFPYALEVPPEVLERVRRESSGQPWSRKRASGSEGTVTAGVVATVMALMAQMFLLLVTSFRISGRHESELMMMLLGLVVIPPVLTFIGMGKKDLPLQRLGSRTMLLQGLGWLAFTLQTSWKSNTGYTLLLLLPWYLPLLAGYLTAPKAEAPDAPVKPS